MAAAITAVAISAGGLAISGAQTLKANKDKKDAKKSIENFNRQDLENPYANLEISTLASDQATEANNINYATSIDALQRGGTRALLGGIPQINEQNILLQNMISADIDKQDKERQRLIAEGERNITNIRENRETNALMGYGQQLQVARQDEASGYAGMVSSALTASNALAGFKPTPQVSSVGTGGTAVTATGVSGGASLSPITLKPITLPNLSNKTF